MRTEIEISFSAEELTPEVQIELLNELASKMVSMTGEKQSTVVLMLLAAACVVAIRDAPPAFSIAPQFKAQLVEAMKIARTITKPQESAQE